MHRPVFSMSNVCNVKRLKSPLNNFLGHITLLRQLLLTHLQVTDYFLSKQTQAYSFSAVEKTTKRLYKSKILFS